VELAGTTAVVTGAGSGVGRQLAIHFAAAGARVVCCGRRQDRLEETARLIDGAGGTAVAIATDVSQPAEVQAMVAEAERRFGGIDLLFNNAGSFRFVGPVWEADPELWWKDVETNLRGTMLCCRAVLPGMIRRGSGVLLAIDGGGGAGGPNVGGSAYGCSKAAVVRFMEGLARELEREGHPILCFSMNPGFVRSEMTESLVDTPQKRAWQTHVPLLFGSASEVPPDACATAVLKLLQIASPELSGRVFSVDTDFDEIRASRRRIQEEDRLVMRRVPLR